MTERVVNIFWNPDEDEPSGHVSNFRTISNRHESDLMKPDEFSEKIVAEVSALACPILGTGVKPDFLEQSGFFCTPVVKPEG